MHCDAVCIPVDGTHVDGTFAVPRTGVPGILFLHGWTGSQAGDLKRAAKIATLGCVCLTFDLRGHAATEAMRMDITPRENLHDAVAAYDALVNHPMVDRSAIAVVGSSYGAYLGTVLSTFRPVRWMSLRVPALYRDEHWSLAKGRLDRMDLTYYRNEKVDPEENRALRACARFEGDVLMIESEHDDLVPHSTIANYMTAFRHARSMTYRVITDADHALSEVAHRQAYTALLVDWIREMVLGAR
jgi:pimeloyl-ACP methyl ester carboxylesterase